MTLSLHVLRVGEGCHREKWTLLEILGFSTSSTVLIHYQHDLITTTYPLDMTHFSGREIKTLPKPGSWDNRTLVCDSGQ